MKWVGAADKGAIALTVWVQAMVVMVGAGVASFMGSPFLGMSVGWGGLVALANMVLLAWRMVYGDRPAFNAHQHLRMMYRSSLERFFIVAVLLAIGMLKLKLDPLAVMLGFLMGQAAWVIVLIMGGMKIKQKWRAKP